MSYQVIARKWRSQTFEELIGQDHVTQTLRNALKSGRLPHALLFTGSRGVGKTSAARILAKSLRCPNAKDFVPCNSCSTCEEISNGNNMDVMEIDGASNNGVEAVRELIEKVGYMPSSGKYKVYIIDEVHMLSTSAFNALLKTLEEPPEHVKFIFATTEVQKIPNTILSRCQRFDFRRIPTRQISEHLQMICEKEGVEFDKEALWTIARQADGSMRDGQSILDQAITFCGGQLSQERVGDVLGLTDRTLIIDTLRSLVARDNSQAMEVIGRVYSAGYDPKVFANDLLEELRHLLFVKECPEKSTEFVDLPDSEIQALQELGNQLSREDVHLLFDMALKGAEDIPRAQDPRIVLEMILLRMAAAPRVRDLLGLSLPEAPAAQEKKSPEAAPTPIKTIDTQSWSQLVEKLKMKDPLVGAKLENVSLVSSQGNSLNLGVPKNQEFLLIQFKDSEVLKRIESDIEKLWGRPFNVAFQLLEAAEEHVSPKELERRAEANRDAGIREQVEAHPMVRKSKELFKTKIKDIKEYRS